MQQNIRLGEGFTDMDEKSLYFIPTEGYFVMVFVQFCTRLGKNIADICILHTTLYICKK